MTVFKISACAMALFALAACGGGSTGGGGGGGGGGASFSLYADEFNALGEGNAFLEGEDVEATDFADLPTSGSASYDGRFALVVNPDESDAQTVEDSDAIGKFEMTARFTRGGGTVSGRAGSFITQDNERLAGALTFEEGSIEGDGGDAIFGGDLTGRLSDDDYSYRVRDGGYLGAFTNGTGTVVGIAGGELVTADPGINGFLGVFVGE